MCVVRQKCCSCNITAVNFPLIMSHDVDMLTERFEDYDKQFSCVKIDVLCNLKIQNLN